MEKTAWKSSCYQHLKLLSEHNNKCLKTFSMLPGAHKKVHGSHKTEMKSLRIRPEMNWGAGLVEEEELLAQHWIFTPVQRQRIKPWTNLRREVGWDPAAKPVPSKMHALGKKKKNPPLIMGDPKELACLLAWVKKGKENILWEFLNSSLYHVWVKGFNSPPSSGKSNLRVSY